MQFRTRSSTGLEETENNALQPENRQSRWSCLIQRSRMVFMSNCLLGPTLPLIAIYATLCLLWIGFADGAAPKIIAAAYNQRGLAILNWVFQGHRSLPIEHYLERWSVIAAAVQIGMILHLVIVLFTRSIDRKHQL